MFVWMSIVLYIGLSFVYAPPIAPNAPSIAPLTHPMHLLEMPILRCFWKCLKSYRLVMHPTAPSPSFLCTPDAPNLIADRQSESACIYGSRKIDRIYTKSISRFARNTKDCLNTVRLLKELGITIIFEEDNIDSAKLHDEFMITVMGSLAQEESTSISQNMRWSVRKRMENGTFEPSSVPYGYIKKDGKLVAEPSDAKIVKMIYDWYLSGMGLSKIVNELNNRGVPPITHGSKWYTFPVKYILKNERYVGDMLLQKYYSTDTLPYKKIVNKGERDKYLISGSHEAIISRDDFNKVQRLFAEREKKYYNESRNKSAFSSVIKCGNCGASFKRKNDKGKYYWVCRNHDEDYDSCNIKQIPEKLIKEKFLCMFNKLILHYHEILLPLQRSLMELNMKIFNGNTKILDIRKEMADLKEQRHIISRLRKRGFLDEKNIMRN